MQFNARRTFCNQLARAAAGLCVAFSVAMVPGCGGDDGAATAHLQGSVTIGGQPLPADAVGQISFVPTGKDQALAATAEIVDSKYDCPAAPQGPVRVSFTINKPSGPEYITDRGVTSRPMESIVPADKAAGIDLTITDDNADQKFAL